MSEKRYIVDTPDGPRSSCCNAPIFRPYPDLNIFGCHNCEKPVEPPPAPTQEEPK